MLIILVAHVPGNHWSNFIPARFGPSDAAEMFVFCSGFAAAIAFGGTFERHGWWTGTRRILFRCWQIYWAHVGLFWSIAAISVLSTWYVGEEVKNYVISLGINAFVDDTEMALVGLMTFSWVPNYFDILPMYFVILLMTPLVVLLQRWHTAAAIAFCVGLYAATWILDLEFSADPRSGRPWFFNPLAWQLLFFTGFMLSRGWIRPPPPDWRLALASIVFVLVLVPVSRWQIYVGNPTLQAIHDALWLKDLTYWDQAAIFKTNEHPLRLLHILVLSYLAVLAVRGREHWLRRWPLSMVEKVGQQALATFLFSMAFARVLGVVLDEWGRTMFTWAVVNIVGLASVIAVAYIVSWYKREPWRRPPPARANTMPPAAEGGSA
ncbi:MAG: OpgC domain-containing protein [Geminicoccaceae bacterium]|nr:OpgC domain-containing protein [Geminicoccaceae bacterium]